MNFFTMVQDLKEKQNDLKNNKINKTRWSWDKPRSARICIFVTTPTQPQLNSKVGFDMKMTLHHHHHPHKLNVSNISAVTDPISTKL